MNERVETVNDHLVGAAGDEIVVLRPPLGRMSKVEALRMAAWIVALADPGEGTFSAILDAVKRT